MSLIILSSSCSNIATTTPTIKYEATNFEEAIEEIKNSNISFNGSINKTVVYDTTLDPLSETITRNIDISYDNKLFRKNDDFYKIKKDTVYKAYLDENLNTYWKIDNDISSLSLINPFNIYDDIDDKEYFDHFFATETSSQHIIDSNRIIDISKVIFKIIEHYFFIEPYWIYRNYDDISSISFNYTKENGYYQITGLDFNLYVKNGMYRNSNYAVNYSGNLRINYQMNPHVNIDDPFINKPIWKKD